MSYWDDSLISLGVLILSCNALRCVWLPWPRSCMHLQERVYMLDSGFMPPFHLCLSDRNMQGGGCVVATREKIAVFLSTDEDYCLHYVLLLLQLSVAHKAITLLLQLNTREICWIVVSRWTISNRCYRMVVYLSWRNAYNVRTHELYLVIIALLCLHDLLIA